MKRCKRLKSDLPKLPDCVISYIFSKLSLKDSVKTCTLSKRWLREWGFRMDLNFYFHNMFDFDFPNMSESDDNTMQKLLESLPPFESEFYTRLDQFMLHYQGTMISSIRLNFPLGDEHKDVVDRLITKGVAKGVKHIELLFSYTIGGTDFILKLKPYKFSFTLLSHADSLTYLHLQNCHLVAPMEFSGLKNLRTLVLHVVNVHQNLLQGLFSNCIHLVNMFLNDCKFKSDLKIISATLLHATIYCGSRLQRKRNIEIIASNLSSFQYCFENDYRGHTMNIKAPMLTEFSYKSSHVSKPSEFFSGLKNVTMMKLIGLRECLQNVVMPLLFSECLQLKNVTFILCWIKSDLNIINLI